MMSSSGLGYKGCLSLGGECGVEGQGDGGEEGRGAERKGRETLLEFVEPRSKELVGRQAVWARETD